MIKRNDANKAFLLIIGLKTEEHW